MSKELIELKPCPFCGGKAKRVHETGGFIGHFISGDFIVCGNSDCKVRPRTISYSRMSDATKAWNRRAK